MNYQYSYLILGTVFLAVWLILFILRKDVRKEMIIISTIFGIAGLIVESAYLSDWWTPSTITGTPIGIEDFLFGFVIGGIGSSIYEIVFRKKIIERKPNKREITKQKINIFSICLLLIVLFFGSVYILKLNTLYASIIGFGIPTLLVWARRKDLILDSVLSGIFLLITAIIVYTITNWLVPGWIQEFWHFNNTPNMRILNVPLDDFIWYLLAGFYIGPLYEFWKNSKLRKI